MAKICDVCLKKVEEVAPLLSVAPLSNEFKGLEDVCHSCSEDCRFVLSAVHKVCEELVDVKKVEWQQEALRAVILRKRKLSD